MLNRVSSFQSGIGQWISDFSEKLYSQIFEEELSMCIIKGPKVHSHSGVGVGEGGLWKSDPLE